MKWFLQFLGIGSAVLYMLLVIVDHRIRDGTAENTVASEAQSNQRRLSVWGPYLPNRSLGKGRRAPLTTQPARQQNEALASEPYRQAPRQYFDDQPALKDKLAASAIDDDQIGKGPTSLPITDTSFEASESLEGKEAIWFVVSRAARLHDGPSVSSPIVHLYPVGTELRSIGYQQGWFRILDPVTSRTGWIYERYYLQAIPGPGQIQFAVRQSTTPVNMALAASNPKPLTRIQKPRPKQKITKSKREPRIRLASAGSESVASIMERAFRRN
jgi:hypothetical protein